jgi:hypothetical protein
MWRESQGVLSNSECRHLARMVARNLVGNSGKYCVCRRSRKCTRPAAKLSPTRGRRISINKGKRATGPSQSVRFYYFFPTHTAETDEAR